MAALKVTRTAQWPLAAEFTFNFDDTVTDINGVSKTCGAVYTDAPVFTGINLPEGAVVISGEAVVETQGVGPTAYTLSVGDSSSATRYLSAFDLKGAVGARTAMTLTGFRSTENLRFTIASTGANASAGKATVRVMYTLPNKANEMIPN